MKNYVVSKLSFAVSAIVMGGISLSAQITQTFSYTGSPQMFVVPSCVTSISLDVKGAQGGTNTNSTTAGGLGATSAGVITVTPGDIFTIYVGGIDGYNGGGTAGGSITTPLSTLSVGGNGGGASDIRLNGNALSNRIIVAGGGGGAGGDRIINYGRGAGGGGGGGYYGGGGGSGWPSQSSGILPTGGSQTSGGSGGVSASSSAYNGFPGAVGAGGNGGPEDHAGASQLGSSVAQPGGSGGGTTGGAGQYVNNWTGQSGGGGSGYLSGLMTSTSSVSGNKSGNGLVSLTYTQNGAVVSVSSSTTAICTGGTVNLNAGGSVLSYTWSPFSSNSQNISVSPGANTTYTVRATNSAGCISSATLTVLVSLTVPSLTVSGSTTSVCPNNTVVLTASGANTYTWTGNITNGTPFIPSVTNTYTVTGVNGCGSSTIATGVSVTPLPVAALVSPTIVCAQRTASLFAGGASTYTWLPVNITGAIINVTPSVTTTYTLLGSGSACTGSTTVTLSVNPNPTITIAATSTMICEGNSVTLTAIGALNYTWQPSGLNTASIVVTPTSPTAFIVTGDNILGCTKIMNQVVMVKPSPTVTALNNTTLICVGSSATLTAGGANIYSWSTFATTSVIVVSPSASAVFSVTGTSNATGCSKTATVGVNVYTQSLNVSSAMTICAGSTVNLNASGGITYFWSTGESTSNIQVSPAASTVYVVNAISPTNGMNCATSGTIPVTVSAGPTVTANADRAQMCKNEKVTITATGANTWAWSHGPLTPTFTFTATGVTTYTFLVTGTDAAGCKKSATVSVKSLNCTGTGELTAQDPVLVVYPNPGNGRLTVLTPGVKAGASLYLYNTLGVQIESRNIHEETNDLNLDAQPDGIYFIQVSQDGNLSRITKFVKQH